MAEPRFSLRGSDSRVQPWQDLHPQIGKQTDKALWWARTPELRRLWEPRDGSVHGRPPGWQRMRCFDGITNSMDMSFSKLGSWWWTGRPGVLQSMGSQKVRHDWMIELPGGRDIWTESWGWLDFCKIWHFLQTKKKPRVWESKYIQV